MADVEIVKGKDLSVTEANTLHALFGVEIPLRAGKVTGLFLHKESADVGKHAALK